MFVQLIRLLGKLLVGLRAIQSSKRLLKHRITGIDLVLKEKWLRIWEIRQGRNCRAGTKTFNAKNCANECAFNRSASTIANWLRDYKHCDDVALRWEKCR